VVGTVRLPTHVNPENRRYLEAKRDRMGHDLDLESEKLMSGDAQAGAE
jgi:3,4-dihydroxy 2-butanone 4-phosphate synthase/GTP cyclohydrolase II